jgi:integrase
MSMKTAEAFESFIYSCRARGLSVRTIDWYAGILGKFLLMYNKLPKKPEDCEAFIISCTGGDERRHGYYRALRAFYNYSVERLRLKHNPIDHVTAPRVKAKLPRPLTIEQLNQLLSYPHKGRIKALLYFLADTGIRPGELVKLAPSDVVETAWGYIALVTGKTGERFVPLSPETYQSIIKYLPLSISRDRISHLIIRAFQDAHVSGSAINLRHTFGTLWRGDLDILRLIMGHSNIGTTMIYRKLQIEQLSRAHNIYSPLCLVLPLQRSML